MGMHLLRMFSNRRVQPLCLWVTMMWMDPGSSFPDHSFFEEMIEAAVNIQLES
jgi:hypothetical protein